MPPNLLKFAAMSYNMKNFPDLPSQQILLNLVAFYILKFVKICEFIFDAIVKLVK